jgi:hypothetical protein
MFPQIKHSLFTILVIASLSAHIHAAVYSNHLQDEIVVTEGTPINVAVVKEVTSKEAKPNDPVDFTVTEDLVLNGQVIVRKGTPAIGSVINAEKGGYMGKSGKLAVQVESTTTSDGQRLKLRAAKGREGDDKTMSTMALSMINPAFLFRKGSEAKIAPGTVVTVYIAEEKRFRVEGATLVPVVMETTAASAEAATVFIYRPNKWGGRALEPSVFVDETELARMDNGRYFAIKLKPGKHIIRMTDDKKGYAIDMGPGQTYFFRIGMEMGMWKGHGKITLDDRERGVEEIKKLKFIGQDKIKATALVVELAPQ